MKRKFFSFILLIITLSYLVFSVTSCDGANSIQRSLSKTGKLKNLDADISLSTSLDDSNTQKTKYNIRVDKENEDENLIRIDTTHSGETVKVFLDNKNAYYPLENNTGYITSREEYFESNPSHDQLLFGLLKELPDRIYDYSSIKSENNTTTLTVTLTEDDFQNNFFDFLKGVEKRLFSLYGATDFSYTTCELKIIAKKGYIQEISLSFDANATVNGDSSVISVDTSLKFNSIGSDIEIRLPSGRDSFERK